MSKIGRGDSSMVYRYERTTTTTQQLQTTGEGTGIEELPTTAQQHHQMQQPQQRDVVEEHGAIAVKSLMVSEANETHIKREIEILLKLDNPHVIRVLGAEVIYNQFHVKMELANANLDTFRSLVPNDAPN
jgi:hypothetical protein